EFLGLFLIISGFIIGLGAVTVIDIHGFLSIKSKYWTEATTRTHKVTKPMIWIGVLLLIIGGVLFYLNTPITQIRLVQIGLLALMVLNGLFLTFKISPYLIKREEEGRANKLLPKSLQVKIALSFIFSVIGWWGEVLIFTWYLVNKF
ncbi:MAG: hypothetical protein ABEJ24_00665, partial [Candidatus Magasanikbacteria bacterium]